MGARRRTLGAGKDAGARHAFVNVLRGSKPGGVVEYETLVVRKTNIPEQVLIKNERRVVISGGLNEECERNVVLREAAEHRLKGGSARGMRGPGARPLDAEDGRHTSWVPRTKRKNGCKAGKNETN